MISQTRTASRQFRALLYDYMEKDRDQAILNLLSAFKAAVSLIEANPGIGISHPKPYPVIAAKGFLWIKRHRYWFGYSMVKGYPIITNLHFDTSDIPNNVADEDAEMSLEI